MKQLKLMSRLLLLTIICAALLVSCKKDQNLTVQQRLDSGATVPDILENNPVDSLYGKSYRGGWIFNYDQNTDEVLVVTETNLSTSAGWGCSGVNIANANYVLLGTGQSNTEAIVQECVDQLNAASICHNDNTTGFTDWYLPSAEELLLIHNRLFLNGYGNFATTDLIWSSSGSSSTEAISCDFSIGDLDLNNKSDLLQVRAIRKTL